jgi:HD-GYP domain-containing protein (c-di-GMP phosphodiesterase class II)
MSESNLNTLLDFLARTAKEISKGDYRAAGEIFELTKSEIYPAGITELAEAFGMMLVMVEAREERLEQLIENLRRKKLMLEEASKSLRDANIGVLEVLGSAIAKRDHGTSDHNYRVTLYTLNIAREIGHPEAQMRSLIKGSFLHDVGKIGISDNILLKEGKLTEEEFNIMKYHVQHGSDIIDSYPWLSDCVDVVRYHHEKFDGSGYMLGLKGKDIPINARIFAVADVFDALTTVRPYKKAFSYDETIGIMRKDRGTHFDPEILDALCGMGDAIYQKVYMSDEYSMRNSLKTYIDALFGGEEGE